VPHARPPGSSALARPPIGERSDRQGPGTTRAATGRRIILPGGSSPLHAAPVRSGEGMVLWS
jgi:hypothetical protein